jgi:hypothetical protein
MRHNASSSPHSIFRTKGSLVLSATYSTNLEEDWFASPVVLMANTNVRIHKVLVIHALRPSSRQTTIDHLESFREYLTDADVQYLHFQQPVPKECLGVEPDLLVINYDFLNYRFSPLWPFIKGRHRDLARRSKKVVAIAQDDFWASKLLDDWCMEWSVDRILSPIDTFREILYPRSIKSKEFRTVLTGYVKSDPARSTQPLIERPIDLGQRVRAMPPNLGRLAQAKAQQAIVMADAARNAGFRVDVSTRIEDSFHGVAWDNFLASCKFTVGMKGGASLHDPIGLLYTRTQAFLARHPGASFDDVERACFRNKDMKYTFTAVSPRLFESAVAGTCQILQRDDYLGVLEPWRHYIPLESNFSNIDEVVNAMRDVPRCQEIVSAATNALVESKLFDYQRLVEASTADLLGDKGDMTSSWLKLSNFLQGAESASKVSTEAHDASLHLIYGAIHRRENVLAKIDQPGSIADKTIKKYIAENQLSTWYEEQAELHCQERLSKRTVWIWRPMPRVGARPYAI